MIDFSDFIIKGYAQTIDKELYSFIDVPEVNDNQFEMLNIDINEANKYIVDKYVIPLFGNYNKTDHSIWKGSEDSTCEWHNDLREGYNIFFLYYMTDIKNNGELMVRMNNEKTGIIQPSKYDLIMLSQAPNVQHKVIHTDDVRIVANFMYDIDGLNY